MQNEVAYFFDIHRHPEKGLITLSLPEFINQAKSGQLFTTDTASGSCPTEPDINRALQPNTNDWIKLQILLVWSLTSKTVDKETIYPYRDVYQNLIKKHGINSSFRLCVLFAYLICGFRLKRYGWSCEDKNNVDDFKKFCDLLLDHNNKLNITTFMCAHRESDEQDANKLVKRLKTESFIRAINVIKGLVYNSHNKSAKLTIYHLDDDKYSLLAIFPNIIFKYIESDGLSTLLNTLENHYNQIKELAGQLSSDRLSLNVIPTKEHIIATRQQCEKIGKTNWKSLSPHQAQQLVNNKNIHEIADATAMDEVARYMPEYGAIKIDGFASYYKKHPGDKAIMDWYVQQEKLTPYAKAFYETLFYYNWGRDTRKNNRIAIGIDRDHSDFQVRAFHAGFNAKYEFGSTAPLLYLRRSDREVGKQDIHSISLRQFWRYSADSKR